MISTFGFPGYTGVRDEVTVLAATCAIRHALSIPDALLLLEVIGIDAPPLLLRCGQCGSPPACADHKRTCAPRAAERVMRLADSIGAAP